MRVHREEIKRVKSQIKLNLVTVVKKCFYTLVGKKRKAEENLEP